MAAAFMRWLMIDIRWNKKEVSLGSPDLFVRCFPMVHMKSTPALLIGPSDSTAMGTNRWVRDMSLYLATFFLEADSAAAAVVRLVSGSSME